MYNETIIAKAVLTASAPKGYKGQLIAIAQAYHLGGNQHPHFSVTGEISTPSERNRGDAQCGGCLHKEILKAFPQLKPLIDLHLSNADDGEPMHAVANGYYDLAGSIPGNLGEQYHRGNSKMNFPLPAGKIDPANPWVTTEYRTPTHDECLAMLAEHLRIPLERAKRIRDEVATAYNKAADGECLSTELPQARQERHRAASSMAKAVFAVFCDTLRPQWKAEAEAGVALIRELAHKRQETAA
jgi:hypothetical protein